MNIIAPPLRRQLAGLALALTGLGLLTLGSGCATLGEPPPRLVIQVVDPDCFLVNERETDRGGLARAVRRTGADAETEIHLQLNQGQTPSLLTGAYAILQNAGYRKVFFTTKREATATVVTERPTAAPAPRKTSKRK